MLLSACCPVDLRIVLRCHDIGRQFVALLHIFISYILRILVVKVCFSLVVFLCLSDVLCQRADVMRLMWRSCVVQMTLANSCYPSLLDK